MPDSFSPKDVEQNIYIKFKTILDGHEKAIKNLSNLQKQTTVVTSSIQKQTKAISKLNKTADAAYRGMYRVGALLRKTVLTAMGAVTTAAGTLVASIQDTGAAFNRLEMTSLDAGRAMKKLRDVYKGFQKDNKDTVSSLQDMSTSFAQFRKNISRRALDDSGLENITELLSRGVGADVANEQIKTMFDSLDDYRQIQQRILKNGKNIEDLNDVNQIRAFQQSLLEGVASTDVAEAIQPIMLALETRIAEIDGTLDPAAASARSLTDALSKVGKAWDTVQLAIVDTFGPEFIKLMGIVTEWLDELPSYIKKVSDRFNEWGGAAKVAEYAKAAWEKVVEALKWVWETAVDVKNEFMSWPGWLQKSLGYATAFVAVFGVKNTIGVIRGVTSGIVELAKKTRELHLSLGGGVMGVGKMVGGGIAAIGGHIAGKGAARAAGAEQYGGAEGLAGMGGAALAGLSTGGPLVAAIAAAASALQSLSDSLSESKRVNDLLVDSLKHSEDTTEKFSQIIHSGNKDNSEFGKGLQKRMELTRDLMRLENQRDANHEGLFGWFADDTEINKKIDEVRKKIADAATEHGNKPIKNMAKMPDFSKAVNFLKDGWKKITGSVKKSGEAVKKDFLSRVGEAVGDFTKLKIIIDNIGTSIDNYGDILTTFGSGAEINGSRIAESIAQTTQDSIKKSREALKESQRLMALAAEAPTEELRADLQAKATEQMMSGLKAQQQAAKGLVTVQEANLARVQQIRGVVEEEMRMSEAIYGTSALAVQKRLELVQAIEMERQQLQEQLDIYEQQKAAAETNEEAYAWQGKILETRKKIRSVQAEELEQLKELRDGYLDAVQAQAFGAGRFQKIIIDQDTNIAKGLDKNIAKANFLLGATGSAAGASNKQAMRFSAGGVGILQDMQGNNMGAGAIAQQNQEAIKNIADPVARAMAEESQKALGGVFSGFTSSSQQNTQALDRLTGALQGKFMATGGTGALQGGSPASSVAFGEAARAAASANGIPGVLAPVGGNVPTGITTPNIGGTGRTNIHGFDMSTRGQILRDRAKNANAIQRANKKHKAPSTRASDASGWSGAMKNVVEVFKKLGPLLDEWLSEEETKQTRPTRSGGRTNLGGPGK